VDYDVFLASSFAYTKFHVYGPGSDSIQLADASLTPVPPRDSDFQQRTYDAFSAVVTVPHPFLDSLVGGSGYDIVTSTSIKSHPRTAFPVRD
jgi:hypothetical protein